MITLCESNLCTNSDTLYKGLSAAQRSLVAKDKVWDTLIGGGRLVSSTGHTVYSQDEFQDIQELGRD